MKKQLTSNTISVKINNQMSLRIEAYLLDAFAQKNYGSSYEKAKSAVNKDIRDFCRENETAKAKYIKFFLTAGLLSKSLKDSIYAEHTKDVPKSTEK